MSYAPRIADAELLNRLQAAGAVLVEGPKACGKTETARQVAKSEVLLDVDEDARAAAAVSPDLVLQGDTPRLIDEWQVEPRIWNHVRRAVDERKEPGQFILAGSAVPADDATRHTGAGRISRLRLRPMSLFESGASNGAISLAAQLAGERTQATDPGLRVEELAEEIARGGWPGFRNQPLPQVLQRVRDYLDEVRRVDIGWLDQKRHDPEKVGRLLRSLARNVATPVAATKLAADVGGGEGPLDPHTVAAYLSALERLFVIEDQPAWGPHLRSRYRQRRSAKRHFVDPSLAVAAMEAEPAALLRDLNFLGLLFESLVIRDLRIYAQALGGRVKHYQDNSDLEVDAIVEAGDSWAAFEIKLGGATRIEEGAATLTKFANRIDTKRSGEPKTLGVIVGTGYGYVRDDGVQVIPIGALGP
jgi:predicted AAA+ superfamily ATPase